MLPVRPLGTTGLPVSRVGLGLAALGRPAYINLDRQRDLGSDRSVAGLERRCHEMLDAAHAAGIRYFDAARSYGMAEAFLGSWLRTQNPSRDAVTIGSKWGYSYVGDWRLDAQTHEVKDLSAAALKRQAAESDALLGGWLRLYQIHSATLESGVLDDVSVLRELSRLQSNGIVIGVTVSGPQQTDVIRRALRVNVDGANPFRVVQATWNLLEPSAGDALAEAKACGCGVIIKEALANGRLADTAAGNHVSVLKQHAASHGTTVDVVSFGWALSQPWADVVLSGAVTPEQLSNNLRAVRLAHALGTPPAIAEPGADYWMRRRALPWQ